MRMGEGMVPEKTIVFIPFTLCYGIGTLCKN